MLAIKRFRSRESSAKTFASSLLLALLLLVLLLFIAVTLPRWFALSAALVGVRSATGEARVLRVSRVAAGAALATGLRSKVTGNGRGREGKVGRCCCTGDVGVVVATVTTLFSIAAERRLRGDGAASQFALYGTLEAAEGNGESPR